MELLRLIKNSSNRVSLLKNGANIKFKPLSKSKVDGVVKSAGETSAKTDTSKSDQEINRGLER